MYFHSNVCPTEFKKMASLINAAFPIWQLNYEAAFLKQLTLAIISNKLIGLVQTKWERSLLA